MEPSKHCIPDNSLWVGQWHKRHVVFDPSIQPSHSDFVLLYFVQGHALCARNRGIERKMVTTVRNPFDRQFALAQYANWRSTNEHVITERQFQAAFVVEDPPLARKRCLRCEGQGSWHYVVGTFADGGHSDGQHVLEHCSTCEGSGFVDDVLGFE